MEDIFPNRLEARERVFQIIFELSFGENAVTDTAETDAATEHAAVQRQVACVKEHLHEIDAEIEKNLKGWKIGRISKVALAILRVAVCEMRYNPNIPVGASINEAVELAKRYGDEESPAFVNGVLGSVAREKRESGM
jgi:N utilization substance protein B